MCTSVGSPHPNHLPDGEGVVNGTAVVIDIKPWADIADFSFLIGMGYALGKLKIAGSTKWQKQ